MPLCGTSFLHDWNSPVSRCVPAGSVRILEKGKLRSKSNLNCYCLLQLEKLMYFLIHLDSMYCGWMLETNLVQKTDWWRKMVVNLWLCFHFRYGYSTKSVVKCKCIASCCLEYGMGAFERS